jgi:hypothetical protein
MHIDSTVSEKSHNLQRLKMKTFYTLLTAGILILNCSCSTSLRRYRSTAGTGNDSTLANAELFGVRLDPLSVQKNGKTLFDLTADAQSQFIKIMNVRYPENGRFLKSLNYDFLTAEGQNEPADYISRDMRLVFSVSRKYEQDAKDPGPQISPADRISYLRLSLIIDDPVLSFSGWNLFTTEYGSVDIGNVSFSNSIGSVFSLSVPVKQTDSKGTASAELSTQKSRKEDQQVRYRYLKLNGKLNDSVIVLEEEGTREIDLAGNIIADIALKFRTDEELVTCIKNLNDSAGRANPPSRLIVEESVALVPGIENVPKPIGAKLVFDFTYRSVISGGRTFPEWDDRVRFFSGHREKHIILLKPSDYVPSFFCLGSTGPESGKNFVYTERADGKSVKLVFKSYGEANAFYSWLKEWCGKNEGKNISLGGRLLKYGPDDLTLEEIRDVHKIGVIPCYRY